MKRLPLLCVSPVFLAFTCHAHADDSTVARRFVDLATGDREVPYARILELDRAYRNVYDSLPGFLNPDLAHLHVHSGPTASDPSNSHTSAAQSPSRTFERIFVGFTFHNRLMRLHRPYMARGYKDPRYRFSTDTAITASRACLNLAKQGQATGFPGLKCTDLSPFTPLEPVG